MLNKLSDTTMQHIQSVLQQGEHVQWAGKPVPKTHIANALPLFLCGIPWTGFSLFRLFVVEDFRIPDFSLTYDYFPLFGIPFFFIGIAMLLDPLRVYLKAKKMVYVVTNRRVFQLFEGRKIKAQDFPIHSIGNIEKIDTDSNCGDIFFGNQPPRYADDMVATKMGFKGIGDIDAAVIALEQLKAALEQPKLAKN